MVSALWKASSDGDHHKLLELLNDTAVLDIELKDHTGATALIEAVRKGHADIVKTLLDKGADPTNASSQGRPDQYTSDPVILDMLRAAERTTTTNEIPPNDPVYSPTPDAAEKRFYVPPQDSYTYYPTINPSLSTVNEAGVYYPPPTQPQPAGDGSTPNGVGHLPPPEIARLIPCRYFPACRYGAQCMFAHPQNPYYQGPASPMQYPPFDPMGNPYIPGYYPSPPSFQQPTSVHPITPMSPPSGAPAMHTRTPSEVASQAPGHFSPNSAPPPLPYSPLPPPVYSHSGQLPMPVPMPIPPLPSVHPQTPHLPQLPTNVYHSPNSSPFVVPQDAAGSYGPPVGNSKNKISDAAAKVPDHSQADASNGHINHRDVGNPHRRGAGRRPSFGARKPPCLFFPAGRCKNGDDCRFPHVLPDNAVTPNHPQFARGGGPRSRGPVNGGHGIANVEAKFGNLSIRDDSSHQQNGTDGSSRSHSSDVSTRPKFPHKPHPNGHGGFNHKKAPTPKQQQRVPNADEFPVLAGSITPPNRVNGSSVTTKGHDGPTAAQVLLAPPPVRKDSSLESSTRGTTPDPIRPQETRPVANGIAHESASPADEQPLVNGVNKHPILSFAAVATSGASDVSKEVSVSA